MVMDTRVKDLATRNATEFKTVRNTMAGNASGSLTALTTTDKSSLLAAINEVNAKPTGVGGASINDTTASTTTTYSGTKIEQVVTDARAAVKSEILGADVQAALDTLSELSDALGDDPNFAATTATALGNRVRVDTAAQGLTTTQQGNARTNISVWSKAEVGPIDTDYVAIFEAGLV